jgi:hypothetical protein
MHEKAGFATGGGTACAQDKKALQPDTGRL